MAPLVPFGQYVPGDSLLHRTDARMKLLCIAAYVSALFMVDGWPGLLLCGAAFVGAYLFSAVPLRLLLRGFKPILVLLAFTFLANALTFGAGDAGAWAAADLAEATAGAAGTGAAGDGALPGPTGGGGLPESVALVGSFGIRPLGALRGLYFAVRILLLVAMTSLLTYTTPLVTLSDSLVALMRPLARIKVPTEDIATMFSIALRFIPLTAEEAEKIMVAQSARGAVFDSGGPLKRARAWLPVMIPLFVSLFRRADELAGAMETRCYLGQGRTRLRVVELHAADAVPGALVAAAFIALGILL
ncbi:MAG: energy-coupling factor transporter transmembrane protein EcfT [Coriobacteriales bacterium]|nr:energy-coupling factor transporter transmembrane protein EcfT [Coriobacteriales bacterium]